MMMPPAPPAHFIITHAQVLFAVLETRLNGMITNDKFCCTRWGQLQLSWWRRPLRLRQESDHERISEFISLYGMMRL